MAKENRLLSDLWLMSAATFRRLGKIEQAKGAIQEGEVKDEDNPGVWVQVNFREYRSISVLLTAKFDRQLGLYYTALGHDRDAIDSFHKALFISPDDVSATVHLCREYLSPSRKSKSGGSRSAAEINPDNVDLAAGLLSHCVEGPAWDVPEAWYFLGKAYGLQGRKDKEREALALALSLSERRSVRDIGLAIGWCL
jgi:tetratricopeptide (TPR) repeat protein